MKARQPHVVVDARMALDGGIGTYVQQLLPRIARRHAAWRFTALGDVSQLRALGWDGIANMELRQVSAPIISIAEQVALLRHVGWGPSLYWAPHYNAALLSRVPLVVTIHDVNHLALPDLMQNVAHRVTARLLIRRVVRQARRILFDSEFTRAETRRLLGGDFDGTVVPLAADGRWIAVDREQSPRPIAAPYFVYVGNFKRHKNVPFLVRAFRSVMDRIPHHLVLIGRSEGLHADDRIASELRATGPRVIMLGEQSEADVRCHVAHADALVTASLYEGFGLPPLEAMAAGCPCVVSSAGALPEVCGDAALYADPHDERMFAERLIAVATNPALRDDLIARGRARAAQFDWDRSAMLTGGVLEGAISEMPRP
jgi:glycosyltransferase involved in cell wall biosynthesis